MGGRGRQREPAEWTGPVGRRRWVPRQIRAPAPTRVWHASFGKGDGHTKRVEGAHQGRLRAPDEGAEVAW
jgi:hypothetical protein